LRPATNGEPAEARFKLPPPAASLRGRILEEGRGKPVAGALVWTTDAPAGFVLSGERGEFSIRRPAGQGAKLRATADGAVLAEDDLATLGLGGEPTLHLRPAAAIRGTVTDEAGHPVEGVEVKIAWDWELDGWVLSDEQGAFSLRLPAGKAADLEVFHRGFHPQSPTVAALRAHEERRMKIVLQPARTAVALVVDGDGRPVAGAAGVLFPVAGCQYELEGPYDRLGCHRRSLADATGQLRFETLKPGKYQLRVLARGFAPLSVPEVEVRDSGETTSFGRLRLSTGALVAGRVVDLQGRPVQGARVTAYDPSPNPDFQYPVGIETDEDGRSRWPTSAPARG
jgi:protocatechuate 3,4-dioxygenase beta subunit